MGYEVAVTKAWDELKNLTGERLLKARFMADEYEADIAGRKVISCSCNAPAKDYHAVLILHYLIKKMGGLPSLSGEWISFSGLRGFESYEPVFKKRAVMPIIRKYGANPAALLEAGERFGAKKSAYGDAGIIFEAFPGVPAMIAVWQGEEGLEPNASIAFDRNITDIFCTEDIVVLAEVVALSL